VIRPAKNVMAMERTAMILVTNPKPCTAGFIECGWRSATTKTRLVAITAMTSAVNPIKAA